MKPGIERVFGSGEILNKEQAIFYNYTKEIKKLQEEFDLLNEKIKSNSSRLQQLYIPFLDEFYELKIQQVLVLSECLDKMKFSRHQKKALMEVIQQECMSILDKNPERKEIAMLYRTLTGHGYVKDTAGNKKSTYQNNPFGSFFESSFQQNEDSPDWEKEKESARQKRKTKQKENQKQIENVSLKEIYRSLLKAYHPDKELNEEKKEEKTEITQKIIKAYQREDLYSLLSYEIDLMENAKDRLALIATEKLNVYNNLLLENKRLLESKLAALKSDHSEVYKNMCTQNSNPERFLKKTKKDLLQELQNFKQQIMMLRGYKEFVEVFTESYLNEVEQRFYF